MEQKEKAKAEGNSSKPLDDITVDDVYRSMRKSFCDLNGELAIVSQRIDRLQDWVLAGIIIASTIYFAKVVKR